MEWSEPNGVLTSDGRIKIHDQWLLLLDLHTGNRSQFPRSPSKTMESTHAQQLLDRLYQTSWLPVELDQKVAHS